MSKKNKVTPIKAEGELKLSQKQVKELQEIERKGLLVKCQIADITERIVLAENQRNGLFQELYKANDEYRTRINKFATGLGIDVDANPAETGERFEFNGEQNAFVRIPVAKPEAERPVPNIQ